jgi:polyphosphate glucokinase
MDSSDDRLSAAAPLTLAIDIGGSHLKAGVLDPTGQMVEGPVRVETPKPADPRVVVTDLVGLARQLGRFDRISAGFPGVVRDGRVLTAPNLGTSAWRGFALEEALAHGLGKPMRLANDAAVQGLGVISGRGIELVLTLGTGMGFSLFRDGRLAPHLEMSQHPIHKGATYDEYIGRVGLKAVGKRRWIKRVHRVIAIMDTVVNYDALLIGGGNAKLLEPPFPERVRIVANEAGITGGVRLWDERMNEVFAHAQASAVPAPA